MDILYPEDIHPLQINLPKIPMFFSGHKQNLKFKKKPKLWKVHSRINVVHLEIINKYIAKNQK